MTTTFLKLIAVASMLIDHTGQFIPNTPEYLRYIGRLAAPIFIYFVGIGYRKTSNKKKYIVRLYVSSVVMAFINLIINSFYNNSGDFLRNNFFATLFLIVLCIHIIEKRQVKLYVYFILWQIISFFLLVLLDWEYIVIIQQSSEITTPFYGDISGNIITVEGGIFFVMFGVLLYYSKNKIRLTMTYSLFTIFLSIGTKIWRWQWDNPLSMFFQFADYQWMMIAALPLLLLYNGKKGAGLKYFFYFFYPIHIIILYFIGENLR
ncbi:TraX family protein [Lederbergia wuyishanensis]|uniref:TraX protein n=1 Tax=Lederbergia wuyishanensis TaxID=1347903 RepID=A0ABU0D2M7_9BACI|nr:TraX family protein [Lederbergia wuyishanensis]MCJ8007212.1 conjugal transfer protein TraX [Lederbergia wuyishanensis]MDQ0342640.1 hypothetical protein [Lederbergia wuyishanensis]